MHWWEIKGKVRKFRKQKEQKDVKLRQRGLLRKLECNQKDVICNFSIENLHIFSIVPVTLREGYDDKRGWSLTGNENVRDFIQVQFRY